MKKNLCILLPALLLLPVGTAHAHCSGAVCTINTSWLGTAGAPASGTRADLRFEYLKQDELLHGRDEVEIGEVETDHDELYTQNRNLNLGLEHAFNPQWSVALQLPLHNRAHAHLETGAHGHDGEEAEEDHHEEEEGHEEDHHEDGEHHEVAAHDDEEEAVERQSWHLDGLGDVRALVRYNLPQEFGAGHQFGLLAGLKLPTGDFDEENDAGEQAERSLQLGTGTTDLIVGGYVTRAFELNDKLANGFLQAQVQQPLNSRDHFRPGTTLSLDGGLSYAAAERVQALAQLNVQWRDRESGSNSEADDSGGTLMQISPGVAFAATQALNLYGFVQLPIYQRVNGVQFENEWSVALGLDYHF
jgi:hypothetical protein